MRVRVLFFGQLREIAGVAEHEADLPPGARMEDGFAYFSARFPALAPFRGIVVAARNQEFAQWDTSLAEGDEIAFLPPVSGGSRTGDNAASGESKIGAAFATTDEICKLISETIPVADWLAAVKTPEDGAVAVFEGIVRNHSDGRPTLHLEYEAYAPMALVKMREITAQAREKFPIRRIAIVHRLGRMEIGETSILIAVSSAHRAAAFDACRFAIDTVKQFVPIWKKEYFLDGSSWAKGHIPASVASTQPVLPGSPSNEAR
jgi:molybdopterin synthase catalytic subunit